MIGTLSQTYSGIKGYLSSQPVISNFMGQVSSIVTDDVAPWIANALSDKVDIVAKQHLLPPASIVGAAYDKSWLVNLGLSVFESVLAQDKDHKEFVRDSATFLTGVHAIKVLVNGYFLVRQPNLPSALGILYDVASIGVLSQVIVQTKEMPQVPKEEKTE